MLDGVIPLQLTIAAYVSTSFDHTIVSLLKTLMAAAAVLPARQPDIQYTPDFIKYEARVKLRQETEVVKARRLPDGFPQQLTSDLVWEGSTLDNYDWNFVLTPEHLDELEHALEHFKGG